MPDWIFSTAASTISWGNWEPISLPATRLQQEFEEYQRECECQDRLYELQLLQEQAELEEERQLIKDKERYPLFFWRELCSKQRKENI